MNPMKSDHLKRSLLAALAAFSLGLFVPSGLAIPAFPASGGCPAAEGYGATATGGRGGTVIKVTNLNDSGAGSFRAACDASGARIVVFLVNGNIFLQSPIVITNGDLTIAGQTAQGNGVTIRNDIYACNETQALTRLKTCLSIRASNVIVRYLKFRPGTPTLGVSPPLGHPDFEANPNLNADWGNTDAMDFGDDNGTPCTKIIVDHCSFSWSTDELVTMSSKNTTFSWNIVSESLGTATHWDSKRKPPMLVEHSKGLMLVQDHDEDGNAIDPDDCDYVSIHHNLLAHNLDRNIVINNSGRVEVVNNTFYNGLAWTQLKDRWPTVEVNLIGNTYKDGPNSGWVTNSNSWHTAYNAGPYNLHHNYEGETYPYKDSLRGWEIVHAHDSDAQGTYKPLLYMSDNDGWHSSSPQTSLIKPGHFSVYPNTTGPIIVKSSRIGGFPTHPITTYSAAAGHTNVKNLAGANRRIKLEETGTDRFKLIDNRDTIDARIASETNTGSGQMRKTVPGYATVIAGNTYLTADADNDGMPDVWEDAFGVGKNTANSSGFMPGNTTGYTNIECYLYGLNPTTGAAL